MKLQVIAPCTAEQQENTSRANVKTITNSIGMKLAYIPAGVFMMGSPESEPQRRSNEPLHRVAITQSFYIGVYEVTQSEYAQVMGNDGRAVFHSGGGGGGEHPMENIEWKSADAFCKRLSALPAEKRAGRSYRLPTEAEWEYACRAGTATAYHFGDSLTPRQANFDGSHPIEGAAKGPYLGKTAKVGSYPANAFGLYDMHGNVSEWCADWYDPDYYLDSPEEDPLGPPFGALSDDFGNHFLSVRGGCWLDDARALRSANRQRAMHRNKYRLIGFRVVCEIESNDG